MFYQDDEAQEIPELRLKDHSVRDFVINFKNICV